MIKRNLTLISILISIFAFSVASIFAAGSGTITYQGTIFAPDGKPPKDDLYNMRFSFWNVETGGDDLINKKWEETWENPDAIYVKDGCFSVALGSITSFPQNLFKENPLLWLQIEIDLNQNNIFELDEIFGIRAAMTATPYAFQADNATTATFAQNAETLDGLDVSAFSIAGHSHYYLDAEDGDPTQALYVDSNGDVGIGTINPNYNLDVNGSINASDIFLSGIQKNTEWDTAYNERGSQITGNHLSWNGTSLDVNDDWYDSISDIPTSTPNDGDTTHVCTADQIYDFVTAQGSIKGVERLTSSKTVNLDNSMTAAEIQALIDAQPKYIDKGIVLTFQFADGTYTLDARLGFYGFHGAGWLYINGNQAETGSLHTNQAVFLDFSGTETWGVELIDCSHINIRKIKIRTSTATSSFPPIYATECGHVAILGCYLLGTSTNHASAYHSTGSNTRILSTYVSNIQYGISSQLGRVYSDSNDDTGTMPLYGLRAFEAGTIGKYSSNQPDGSVANEYTEKGGIIR